MGRALKFILAAVATLVVLVFVTIVAVSLFFDPNDYKDEIAQQFETATGRSITIDGDLGLSIFPWLAVDVGSTSVGNAPGFGAEPFASFDEASLRVRLWPLLTGDRLTGEARISGLGLNLAVDASGRSNWQDIVERQQAQADAPATVDAQGVEIETEGTLEVDISSFEITGARLVYVDQQSGSEYSLRDLDISTGAIRDGEPLAVDVGFEYGVRPAGYSGTLGLVADILLEPAGITASNLQVTGNAEGLVEAGAPIEFSLRAPAIALDTEREQANVGQIDLELLDVGVRADVEPFSYAGEVQPVARIEVGQFSPRELLGRLDIEAPETADPDALAAFSLTAKASVGSDAVRLEDLQMRLDETTFTGELAVPQGDGGSYRLALAGDRILLDRYMAPATDAVEEAADGDEPPIVIPTELIRAVNAAGSLTFEEVVLADIPFTDVEVGVNSGNGRLRIHPFTARFFDGAYSGDLRIDATGDVAALSANETLEGVSLAPMAATMFEQENLTGRMDGVFRLTGQGNDMDAVLRSLDGSLSFTLSDGTYEGTDVWYQLRRARALFRQEAPPEPELPPRTRFTEVSATGKVTDGVMQNDDLLADLPFMRLNGSGTVNLVSKEVDYALSARVLDRPELAGQASEAELSDLTKATIPLRVTGSVTEPEIGVDMEGLVKSRVQDELRDRLLERLGGDEEAAEGEEQDKDVEDLLKDRLRDLLNR